ncbi:unnamed protein product [Ostreobium quekettii]|uniref:FAS1 domain-containing protein n=1 Tax=Ostreobium quekettii TaxID=121088 RepID=A0A8S1J3I5_9CHLO|nr:unnamed protein product [Ostreobium quekettii]
MGRTTMVTLLLGLLFVGARAQDCTPIVEAATDAGLTTLLAALEAADLVDTVVGATDLTVFAPTNDAFDAALAALGITLEDLVANKPLLTEILTYHVLTFPVFAANISEDGSYQTLLGNDSSCGVSTISASITEEGVTIIGGATNATVLITDVETCQGVVHAIDFVLLPCPVGEQPPPEGVTVTMTDAPAADEGEVCTPLLEAATDAGLTTLLAAVEAAGLVDAIQAPGLTIFAPTNDAFDSALQALGVTLDNLVADKDLLTEILLYHVLGTTVRSGDIQDTATAETLLGNDSSCGVSALTFDLTEGVVVVGGASSATVVAPDVETCTAVVHVIDFVLLPCALGEPEPVPEPEPEPGELLVPRMPRRVGD